MLSWMPANVARSAGRSDALPDVDLSRIEAAAMMGTSTGMSGAESNLNVSF